MPAEVGRRRWLVRGGALAAALSLTTLAGRSLATPGEVAPHDLSSDDAALQSALRAIQALPVDGTQVLLDLPQVAEDGALVPVTVSCTLARVQEITLVVAGNPVPMVAVFSLPAGTEAWVSTRIRLAQSGRVHAVVLADGQRWVVSRDVQVITGGCG